MSFETISVIGLGYIGLPTSVMFASAKKNVIGVDVKKDTVDIINNGNAHIVEPGLDGLVRNVVDNGFLRATTEPEPADAFLIAVPTPFSYGENNNPEPDLSYVQDACKKIAPVLQKGNLVVLESTSPVGATEQVVRWLAECRPDLNFPVEGSEQTDINVAHCPERVLPGQIVRELVENNRVVGGITPACAKRAVELYRTFVCGECIETNARTAEMVKLAENSFRDVNIAFANEMSMICDTLKIDSKELISLANLHPRVNILNPGPGVGGHCIAVDPWFLVHSAPEDSRLLRMSREVNTNKPLWVCEKIKEILRSQELNTVVCLGLAYKPNIDDVRESPAMEIVRNLSTTSDNCTVLAVDPFVKKDTIEDIEIIDMESIPKSGALIVGLVAHDKFKSLDIGSENSKADFAGVWIN